MRDDNHLSRLAGGAGNVTAPGISREGKSFNAHPPFEDDSSS